VPTEIPESIKSEYDDARALSKQENRPERLEMRVLSPMPEWTREYPYYWRWEPLICGKTYYAYLFPYPDIHLIGKVFDESYGAAAGPFGSPTCQFAPTTQIWHNEKPTQERLEQIELENQIGGSIYYAKGDLNPCHEELRDGTDDNIFVCFNHGNASETFDVPAYLDNSVGRVRVPVRFISEMMGAKVDWDGHTETVTIQFPAVEREVIATVPREGYQPIDMWNPDEYTLNGDRFKYVRQKVTQSGRTIILTVGKKVALVDGVEVEIDAPPVVLPPGRTMVPVRFIAEAMGAKVYWVGADPIFKKDDGTLGGTNQVHIFTPFWPYYAAPSWYLETRAMKF
jgi:hypothetical protein